MSMTRNLRNIPQQISIPLPMDEEGFLGRECPEPNCLGYFLIKPGTGLPGSDLPCTCPYCGHTAGQDHFYTQEQIEYAKSVAVREVSNAINRELRSVGRQLERQTRGGFITLKMEYKQRPVPIRYYREKQLETAVVCAICTLEYKIYGVFAYCPDCAAHNSFQILQKNLALVRRVVEFSCTQEDDELAEYLLADALENCVSAFDAFGREACRNSAAKSSDPSKVEKVSFQNLARASIAVETMFGIRLQDGLSDKQWHDTIRAFQKRHLLAHKLGVVDQVYLDVTGDKDSVLGHKVKISNDEVQMLTENCERLGLFLLAELRPKE